MPRQMLRGCRGPSRNTLHSAAHERRWLFVKLESCSIDVEGGVRATPTGRGGAPHGSPWIVQDPRHPRNTHGPPHIHTRTRQHSGHSPRSLAKDPPAKNSQGLRLSCMFTRNVRRPVETLPHAPRSVISGRKDERDSPEDEFIETPLWARREEPEEELEKVHRYNAKRTVVGSQLPYLVSPAWGSSSPSGSRWDRC